MTYNKENPLRVVTLCSGYDSQCLALKYLALMGVHKEDNYKLCNSGLKKSKLYKLSGNSIVTNCMTAMFEELLYPTGNNYVEKDGQLSLF